MIGALPDEVQVQVFKVVDDKLVRINSRQAQT